MLPEMSGIVVLHEIRKVSNIPVIMLTALDDEYTQSNSFDEMADDYITKPFFVYLPESQLKKAISNILSNAVNYTEAGQSISVVFDKNKLSVSNECSVLPPEQLQHIFEPFYRPDLAHSQATGGNGLGLYIVQTILDKLRLKYQFVPMPNDRGMSFTIQF